VALDAARDAIAEVAALQARILGAPDEETEAAGALVEATLAHPLLVRARAAFYALNRVGETLNTSISIIATGG